MFTAMSNSVCYSVSNYLKKCKRYNIFDFLHIPYTCTVQTVSMQTNFGFYETLHESVRSYKLLIQVIITM